MVEATNTMRLGSSSSLSDSPPDKITDKNPHIPSLLSTDCRVSPLEYRACSWNLSGGEENYSRLKRQNTRQKRFLTWRVLIFSSSKSNNFPMSYDMIYTISNVTWLKPSQKNCVQVPDVSPRIVVSHYQQNVTHKAVEETFSTTMFLRSVTNECVGRWLLCSDRNLFKAIIIKPMNTTLCSHYLNARFLFEIPEGFFPSASVVWSSEVIHFSSVGSLFPCH